MIKHFTPPNLQKNVRHKGSAVLVMVIVLAIVSSMIGLSVAKIGHASMNATASNTIAMQTSNIASSDAALLHAVNYEDLTASNRSAVSGTAFQHETLLSNESSYTDTIKQKIATINVYKGDESIPRSTLQVTRYSVEKPESSGVPVGTVIAWPGTKNPTDGTWLECNGQSCAGFAELVSVLGKSTVPDYRNRFLEGSTIPGTVLEAGLPNISGSFVVHMTNPVSGAFYNGKSGYESKQYRDWNARQVVFDASRCSPVYGNSSTVQPPAVTVKYLIKAA